MPKSRAKLEDMQRDGLIITPYAPTQQPQQVQQQPVQQQQQQQPQQQQQQQQPTIHVKTANDQMSEIVGKVVGDVSEKSENVYIKHEVFLGLNLREKLVQKKLQIKSRIHASRKLLVHGFMPRSYPYSNGADSPNCFIKNSPRKAEWYKYGSILSISIVNSESLSNSPKSVFIKSTPDPPHYPQLLI